MTANSKKNYTDFCYPHAAYDTYHIPFISSKNIFDQRCPIKATYLVTWIIVQVVWDYTHINLCVNCSILTLSLNLSTSNVKTSISSSFSKTSRHISDETIFLNRIKSESQSLNPRQLCFTFHVS